MAWIFLNDAFLSIVVDAQQEGNFLVRARLAPDINRVFPRAEVSSDESRDYLFRASIPRIEVVEALADRLELIDYTNFKGSIAANRHARHDAYLGVWRVMHSLQNRFQRATKAMRKKEGELL